uniref:Uncharacterized protein n=1 Tax=Myotis myotis TaxID=51298 RepID=A0A7J7ZXF6_MYOMY|nr:hypothetical protein mMyoMyo1_009852 [Myotis myotis]
MALSPSPRMAKHPRGNMKGLWPACKQPSATHPGWPHLHGVRVPTGELGQPANCQQPVTQTGQAPHQDPPYPGGGVASLKTALSPSPRLARHPRGNSYPVWALASLQIAISPSPRLARCPSGDPYPEGAVASLQTAISPSPRLARCSYIIKG